MKPDSTAAPTLTAIVLAGGQSTRMGQDKALIAIAGVPLLRRTYDLAAQCAAEVLIVTPWGERYRDILPPACRIIAEPVQSERPGPLVGFAQGLAAVQTEWVLLLACDLPRLNAALLQTGRSLLPTVQSEIALLPRQGQRWEALCGFYRATCRPQLQAAIARGERSFQGWLAQAAVRTWPIADPSLLFNCNTPADLMTANLREPT